MVKIGYCSSKYPVARNIINKVPESQYIRIVNVLGAVYYIPLFLSNKIIDKKQPTPDDLNYICNTFNLDSVDIIHLFNSISFGETPWITTFETIVPRFNNTLSCHHGSDFGYSSLLHDRRIHRALQALSGDSCKKIIAMSECNLNIQKYFLSQFPTYQENIEKKLICLHPPQERFFVNFKCKNISLENEIHFLFLGNAFFRKGGKEVLDAFEYFRNNNNHDIKLTIVSSLTKDNYATAEDDEDIKEAKSIINRNREWIDYFRFLPNKKVIDLMKTVHVGLLPTYADTYGYSVLEFQAAGCPVISTNVRALPEINNEEIGWIIEVPRNQLGEALYTTKNDRMETGRAIRCGLKRAIDEIMENRLIISRKADAALKHISDRHSPEVFSSRLREIYSKACEFPVLDLDQSNISKNGALGQLT